MRNYKLLCASLGLLWISIVGTAFALSPADNEIQGAGSSLSNTVIQRLLKEYAAPHRVDITYKAVGSGEGIRSIAASSVDFALTDVPLTKYELDLLGVIQFPVFFSAVTPIVNIPGLQTGELRLNGQILAEIYMGRIANWRDPKILAINPAINLPDLGIQVVTRSDASGTSYIFTQYMSNESQDWSKTLGFGSKLNWPTGQGVRGTDAVIKTVNQTIGAIGYVEFGAALRNKATLVQLRIGDSYSAPSFELLKKSIELFQWDRESYYNTHSVGSMKTSNTWPMVAVTYSLIRRVCADDQDARDTLLFFDWILTNKNPVFQELNMLNPQSITLINNIRRKLSEVVNVKGHMIQIFAPLKGGQ